LKLNRKSDTNGAGHQLEPALHEKNKSHPYAFPTWEACIPYSHPQGPNTTTAVCKNDCVC